MLTILCEYVQTTHTEFESKDTFKVQTGNGQSVLMLS